jgi:hypothetical protein
LRQDVATNCSATRLTLSGRPDGRLAKATSPLKNASFEIRKANRSHERRKWRRKSEGHRCDWRPHRPVMRHTGTRDAFQTSSCNRYFGVGIGNSRVRGGRTDTAGRDNPSRASHMRYTREPPSLPTRDHPIARLIGYLWIFAAWRMDRRRSYAGHARRAKAECISRA